MNANKKSSLTSLIFIAVVAAVMVWLAVGCGSLAKQSPVEGRVFLMGHDTNDRPTTLVHWDGDLFVWWADATGVAEIRGKQTKMPIYTNDVQANKAGAKLKSEGLEWSGAPGQPMPTWTRVAFTDAEIAAWGLQFKTE